MSNPLRLRWLAVFLLVSLLVLAAACGDDDDDDDGDPTTASPTVPGDIERGSIWGGELETGTLFEVELWVDLADPALAEIEEFRIAAGSPAVVYARATAVNNGSEDDAARYVTITDASGVTGEPPAREVTFLCVALATWLENSGDPSLNETFGALFAANGCESSVSGPVLPAGETTSYFLVVQADSPPPFERVFTGLSNELEPR